MIETVPGQEWTQKWEQFTRDAKYGELRKCLTLIGEVSGDQVLANIVAALRGPDVQLPLAQLYKARYVRRLRASVGYIYGDSIWPMLSSGETVEVIQRAMEDLVKVKVDIRLGIADEQGAVAYAEVHALSHILSGLQAFHDFQLRMKSWMALEQPVKATP